MKTISSSIKLIITMALLINFIGCAAVTPQTQSISITTNVPDALITINNENIGSGNIQTVVKRNQQVDITVYKRGYIPAHKTIGKHNNVQAILDAAVCGLGLIVFALPWCISAFATPGAWSLDETNVTMILQPETTGENL